MWSELELDFGLYGMGSNNMVVGLGLRSGIKISTLTKFSTVRDSFRVRTGVMNTFRLELGTRVRIKVWLSYKARAIPFGKILYLEDCCDFEKDNIKKSALTEQNLSRKLCPTIHS